MLPKSNHSSRNASPLRAGYSSYKPDNMSVGDTVHPVIHSGRVALITGAASGIGRAAAIEFARYVYLAAFRSLIGHHENVL
jgi:hypothetical protein